MIAEDRYVLLFLDNARSHPDIFQEGSKNIKLEFFPKNTTSRWQPYDAGIIININIESCSFTTFLLVSNCNKNYQRCHYPESHQMDSNLMA